MTQRSKKTYQEMKNEMKTQASYFEDKQFQGSIYHTCASKGVHIGFKYWFHTVRHDVEYAKKKNAIAKEERKNNLVKRIWNELRSAHGHETVLYINGTRILLPVGLVVPVPEGIMVEEDVVPGLALPHQKNETNHIYPHSLDNHEKHYDDLFKKLLNLHPSLEASLTSDPVEVCSMNRFRTLYLNHQANLSKCEGIAAFQQEADHMLAGIQASMDELEYLDRMIFDIMAICGVTNELASLAELHTHRGSTILNIAEHQQATLMV